MKQFQKGYTTPEQSKILIKLGLPADSADCAYRGLYMPITILPPNVLYSTHEKEIHDLESNRDKQEGRFQTCEPCWSVGRLQEIAKISAREKEYYYAALDSVGHQDDFVEWWVKHFTLTDNVLFDFSKLEE